MTHSYDSFNRLASVTSGSVAEHYTYNIRGWVTDKNYTSGSTSLLAQHWNYDQSGDSSFTPRYSGDISSMSVSRGGGSSDLLGYFYDDVGRLVNTIGRRGGVDNTELTEKNISYDDNGNINGLTRGGDLSATLSMSYSGNRLSGVTGSGSTVSYSYDLNGNVVHDGLNGIDLQYTRQNRIKSASRNGVTFASYQYLSDGTRFKSSNGLNERYYSGPFVYRTQGSTRELESVSFSGGRFVAVNWQGSVSYSPQLYLTDHLGSVRGVVSLTGSTVYSNDYYPFGSTPSEVTEDNRYLYNGKEDQSFTGLPYIDYGARMYDPATGRWLSLDPLSEKYYGISPYAYCANDPVNYIDPDGRDTWEINKEGRIVKHDKNNSPDTFHMVTRNGDGAWERTGVSLEFKSSVVISQRSISYEFNDIVDVYDVYKIRGDENGEALFEFMTTNVTMSDSKVEVGLAKTGLDGEEGLNFVTCGHLGEKEPGLTNLYNDQLRNGYTIREMTHSHPKNSHPSPNDIMAKNMLVEYYTQIKGVVPKFYIFKIPNGPDEQKKNEY